MGDKKPKMTPDEASLYSAVQSHFSDILKEDLIDVALFEKLSLILRDHIKREYRKIC